MNNYILIVMITTPTEKALITDCIAPSGCHQNCRPSNDLIKMRLHSFVSCLLQTNKFQRSRHGCDCHTWTKSPPPTRLWTKHDACHGRTSEHSFQAPPTNQRTSLPPRILFRQIFQSKILKKIRKLLQNVRKLDLI